MRAVLQRVTQAHVSVDEEIVGAIGPGLMVLLGVEQGDGPQDAAQLAKKTAELRVFEDAEGKMNRSVEDIGGQLLVVSQFTLAADCRKGRRPGFSRAAAADTANSLYLDYIEQLRQRGLTVATGRFQAMMQVHLVNDGPVTFLLDSHKVF
ncbi:D-aminoacyl-tRNA deacylase [Syntrophotalea carbinolica DSM 2380]|uniref:D-aminoacyl-tRNA deacylase n=1 Tax=Syntrophotalea carbinolica (strain DSM 2380 / NBRC 103641 / GraBd1) TaxID=338963 RepID=DTD_SYNC1|nr:D-aminoacyl-tRNA deacylase [Syntrophotalea carbinolica]Q3A002.1 RecName: Full=D-aminoacyl-tRNA deacylase; Short=DTD; AltName: Full=Gly-tRNA(Ala) deacylase [Syntrophotalea carbinolica DSM 2380]ABA90305.1 D-aminoacyl-tRNA deacylase [Syntrophotalea carbinolica DSM 2380]